MGYDLPSIQQLRITFDTVVQTSPAGICRGMNFGESCMSDLMSHRADAYNSGIMPSRDQHDRCAWDMVYDLGLPR